MRNCLHQLSLGEECQRLWNCELEKLLSAQSFLRYYYLESEKYAQSNLDSKSLKHKVSERIKDSVKNWTRGP